MRLVTLPVLLLFVSWAVADELPLGNSSRGQRSFETQRCISCHSVDGKGGKIASDLGRRIGRNLTPALLAGTLWNHAPAMWSEMRRQGIESPVMSTQDVADLFAFFYSARFFDKPGDAARGKGAFARHRCADCHGLSTPKVNRAPPVVAWRSLGSPVALAEAMWNHAGGMRDEFTSRGYSWPELGPQELTDIYVYLRNHPSVSLTQSSFEMTSAEGGETLMKEKGCLKCHRGALGLVSRLEGNTINDLAAALWNHGPRLTENVEAFQPGQMGTLLSYIWAQHFFATNGDVGRGQKVFRDKSCAACHEGGQSPRLSGEFNIMRMTSALWNHGPAMLQQMTSRGIPWPRFKETDMTDLIAYLNSTRRERPTRSTQ